MNYFFLIGKKKKKYEKDFVSSVPLVDLNNSETTEIIPRKFTPSNTTEIKEEHNISIKQERKRLKEENNKSPKRNSQKRRN